MSGLLPGMLPPEATDNVAHVIQVALTPVFLLSGIGALLNVFNTRLSRVLDHHEQVFKQLKEATDPDETTHLESSAAKLRHRTLVLDASIMFGAVGAAATCGAAMVLFLGSMRDESIASWLFVMFGIALGCTVCALTAFLADTILAWHWMHRHRQTGSANQDDPSPP